MEGYRFMSLYLRDYKELYVYLISSIEADARILAESLVYLDENNNLTEEQKEGITIAVRKVVKMLKNNLDKMEQYEKSLSRNNEEYKAKTANKEETK
jgi:hypothetical protein